MDILIIEDDAGIRDMLTMLLEDDDYSVTSATNGQQALNHLHQRERLPQLILLDLAMPIMDGWQFRAAQHADPRLAAIPVVVLSARFGNRCCCQPLLRQNQINSSIQTNAGHRSAVTGASARVLVDDID